MKKLIFMALSLIFLASSCSNDDRKSDEQPTPALITPDISVRMAEPLSVHPFTGILEIYPCNDESSVYYGNYFNGKLTPFYGYYTILNGDISGQYNRELHLPVGLVNTILNTGGRLSHDLDEFDPALLRRLIAESVAEGATGEVNGAADPEHRVAVSLDEG